MLNSWRDFEHCKVPVVRARVEDIVRRVSGPRVLEVGCNEGWVSKSIIEERGFDVTALDNRREAREQTLANFGIQAVDGDVNHLPFNSGSFDCVVAGEVMEHLDNPGSGLSEIFRVSKGHVILTVPIGKYWNGEATHLWQLNGAMIEHDPGSRLDFFKHSFVLEFRRIRTFDLSEVKDGHEDR